MSAPSDTTGTIESLPESDLAEVVASVSNENVKVRRIQRWRIVVACLAALVVLGVYSSYKAYTAYAAYRDIQATSQEVRALTGESLLELSTDDIQHIAALTAQLQTDVRRLDRATAIPVVGGAVRHIPWIGPRYAAGRDTVELAALLAEIGSKSAVVGEDTLRAYETTGLRDADPQSPTWLDALIQHEQEVADIAIDLERAYALRDRIDVSLLPERAQRRIEELDSYLDRIRRQNVITPDLVSVCAIAFGAEHPVRYLVLFPNPAEMRPAGGFPGTIALVEIHRGQLTSVEFTSVHNLNRDYMDQRSTKVPLPWPYERYFWQDGFLLQDVVWYPDFTRVGDEMMAMYAETDWPPIDGIVAVQQSIPSELLRLTGYVRVEVDGEMRRISSENLHDEIERQRRRRLEGERIETYHKEVIAEVGAALLERLMEGDRRDLRYAVSIFRIGAENRDAQFYASDPHVQSWLDERAWTGRIVPEPAIPTIAVVFGSLVAHKADLRMHPSVNMTISPESNGRREVSLEIELNHTGTNEEMQFYAGFQRWWIELYLPEGSEVVWTHDSPQPDPEAPNGGSYLIEIFPQQVGYVALRFTIPDTDTLLLRRQPGVTPVRVSITWPGCSGSFNATMNASDVTVDLNSCASE